jgi:hypothetical protein
MTTINDLFPSPYLAASDVENRPVVTIKSFTKKTIKNRDGEDEVKPMLFFQEYDKGLVLNKTNADIIASLYGNTLEEWIGERVQLHSVMVEAFGKRQPAIRVSEQKPIANKQKLIERYEALYERGAKVKMDGIENYKISPDMPSEEIVALGKELKGKVEAAEQF